jgi:hypothetical protein
MNAQFRYSLAHRLRVTQVAGFELAESGGDANLGHFIAKSAKPFGVRFAPILVLVTDEFDHESDCSIKATNRLREIES